MLDPLVSSLLINQDVISGPSVSPTVLRGINVNRSSKPNAGEIREEIMGALLWWVEVCNVSDAVLVNRRTIKIDHCILGRHYT